MSEQYDTTYIAEYKNWDILRSRQGYYYAEKDGQRRGPCVSLTDTQMLIDILDKTSGSVISTNQG